MNIPKGFNSITGRYSNYFIHNNGMKTISRSYSMVQRKLKYPSPATVSKSYRIFITKLPTLSQLQLYSQATEIHPVAKDNTSNFSVIQPLNFGDLSFESPVSHDDLIAALMKCQSISEQMETLVATLALSPEDVQQRWKFCKTLETLFRPFFNDFKIQIFGSTINGFGFKGCDIDLSFELANDKKEKVIYLERPDIPLVNEVLCGKVSPQEISELPLRERLLFIHTVMLEFYKETEEPILFINAHVPLVRFYHDKFNLKCDLTIKNAVAGKNSKLMYLYAKLDKRVVPLMMTLRYWAKHNELISKGLTFNTYCISLMVIYFLQTRDPPVLPCAKLFISLNALESEDFDDKKYLEVLNVIPPSVNTQSLGELLKEFFFFYLYFDFTRVICPMTASSVPREEFFSVEANRKFRMNTICVQDPMYLTHNVADLVDYKACRMLFTELMVTCKMFQDKTPFETSFDPWGLIMMLNAKPSEYSPKCVAAPKVVSFEIPWISRIHNLGISEHLAKVATSKILLKILHHVLLFDCNLLKVNEIRSLLELQDSLVAKQRKDIENVYAQRMELSKITGKRKKKAKNSREDSYDEQLAFLEESPMLEQFDTVNVENELFLCVQCKTPKNTWVGRDFVDLDSIAESPSDLLDRERLISTYAAKQNDVNLMDKKVKPFMFFFECYSSKNNTNSPLIVHLRPLQRMSFNPFVGIFLKEYIPKIMKSLNADCLFNEEA